MLLLAALVLPAGLAHAKTKTVDNGGVTASDLMSAMKQSLQNPTPATTATPDMSAAPAPAPATVAPAPVAPAANVPTTITQPVKKDSYVAEDVPAAPTATTDTAPVSMPPAEAPSADTAKAEPIITEKKDASAPAPAMSNAGGPPLLTDMQEAPDHASAAAAASGKQDLLVPAPPMDEPATTPAAKSKMPEGFSKSRPLFSSPGSSMPKGVKGSGIYSAAETVKAPKVSAPAKEDVKPAAKEAVDKEADVPLAPPPVKETQVPASVPVAAPPVEGEVLFSQKAGEGGGKPDDVTAPPVMPPEENVEKKIIEPVVQAPEPGPESQPAASQSVEQVPEPKDIPAIDTPAPAAPVPAAASPTYAGVGAVQGSCGSINGIGSSTKPSANLCTQGTPSNVSGSGPWNWSCLGSNGGANAQCSAPLQINGECGPANGSQSASKPIGGLCRAGKGSDVSGNGPWYWNCFGDNGGVVAQCVAYTLVSGQCGPSHNMTTDHAPASGLCNSGKATAVTGEGPWMWSCMGSGEGTTVNCTASLLLNGVCGPANGAGSAAAPADGLCASGSATAVTGKGPWAWSCVGEGGGASASCHANMLVAAACGGAHGQGTAIKPAAGLCSTGKASEVTGNGPWNWTCLGDNGGANVNCMAPLRQDGVCGPAHMSGTNSAPAENLCTTGEPGPVLGSGPWQWTCQGSGGGITANCMANPLLNAACGPAHGVSTSTAPTGDLCSSGTPTSILGSGPWMWSCQGDHGGSTVNCMAPKQVSGACGASDNVATATAPTANLCREGTASAVSGSGPWTWNCAGESGGITVPCQAPLYQAPPEAAPEAAPAAAPARAEQAVPPAPDLPSDVSASVAATPSATVPAATAKAGNECTPTVKRWTITCQQGGYPANYTGVIVGETQVLCPTGVERGVWLSNSCAPATDSAPVSPSPGRLEIPPPPKMGSVTDKLPDIAPLPARALEKPKGLSTPRFKDESGNVVRGDRPAGGGYQDSIAFAPASEGLDAQAIATLGNVTDYIQGDDKSLITLSAYAALPADNNQQEARRVALSRALAVRTYLMRKGIPSNRIDVRALGPASDGRGNDRVDIEVK